MPFKSVRTSIKDNSITEEKLSEKVADKLNNAVFVGESEPADNNQKIWFEVMEDI